MSLTLEQNSFLNRKLRTRFFRIDVNGDGYISTEDYEELGKRFIDYGKLVGEEEQRMKRMIQVRYELL